jgi:GAF domain-containing protein
MMSQRSLFIRDSEATVRRVNEAATATLDVERVSIWYCNSTRTRIWCADLYEHASGKHSSGTELFAKDFAPYFKALGSERTIAAHDAHTDPRTSCFSEPYLRPQGIGALLDVPIWFDKRMVGVICHEHIGGSRTWTKDEETFAYLMSSFVALSLELRGSVPVLPARRTG